MATAYLALGSNLGDRRANLLAALQRLEGIMTVDAVAALYESPPQPPAPPPPYYNSACRVSTALSPQALLREAKRIERELGRDDPARWAPRPIDIDIALYDGLVLVTETLTIPHARLRERAFVLRPLLDLEPGLVDPASGERLDELLRRVGEDGLTRLEGPGWDLTGTQA